MTTTDNDSLMPPSGARLEWDSMVAEEQANSPSDGTACSSLVEGEWYWVKPTLDPDISEGDEWQQEWQPARYAGEARWWTAGIDHASDWAVTVGDWIPPMNAQVMTRPGQISTNTKDEL